MKDILGWVGGLGPRWRLAGPFLAGLLILGACGTPGTEKSEPPVPVAAAPAPSVPDAPTPQAEDSPAAPLPSPTPTVTPSPTSTDQAPVPADEIPAVTDPTITISSADSGIRLLVPESALPDGVDPAGITLTRAPVSDYDRAFPEGGPDFAIRVEPDGLQFTQPVTIEIVVDDAGDGVPILWQLTGDRLELVPTTATKLDPETGRFTVAGDIEHFSSVIGDLDGFFKVTMPNPGDHVIGESFTVTVVITQTGVNPRGVSGPVVFISRTVDPWNVSGLFTHVGPAAVPSRVPDLPPGTAVYGPTLTVTSEFTCAKVGSANFNYHARLSYFVESATLGDEERMWEKSDFASDSSYDNWFVMQCLALPTPTPTETPTNIPTPEGSFEVEVLHHGNERFPLEQFRVASPDACEEDHYHANFSVHSLEGGTAMDPDQSGCGFGEVGTPGLVSTVRVSAEEWAAYRTALAGG